MDKFSRFFPVGNLMKKRVACCDTGGGRTIPGVDSKVIEVYQGYVF